MAFITLVASSGKHNVTVWLPSVRPSVCLSVRPSVRPSVRLSVCLSVCPSVRPSVRLSVCPSVRPSVCPSVLTLIERLFLTHNTQRGQYISVWVLRDRNIFLVVLIMRVSLISETSRPSRNLLQTPIWWPFFTQTGISRLSPKLESPRSTSHRPL